MAVFGSVSDRHTGTLDLFGPGAVKLGQTRLELSEREHDWTAIELHGVSVRTPPGTLGRVRFVSEGRWTAGAPRPGPEWLRSDLAWALDPRGVTPVLLPADSYRVYGGAETLESFDPRQALVLELLMTPEGERPRATLEVWRGGEPLRWTNVTLQDPRGRTNLYGLTNAQGEAEVLDFGDGVYPVAVEGRYGIGNNVVASLELSDGGRYRVDVPATGRLQLRGRPNGEAARLSLQSFSFHGATGHGISGWSGTLGAERVLDLWPGTYTVTVTDLAGELLQEREYEVGPGTSHELALDP